MTRLPLFLLMGFCLFSALPPLVFGWQTAPLERGVFVVFALWLLPLLRRGLPETHTRSCLLGGALCIAGILFDLNLLRLIGLAVTTNGLLQSEPLGKRRLHLLAALLWMPVFGWLALRLPVALVLGTRLLGTSLAIFPFWKGTRSA